MQQSIILLNLSSRYTFAGCLRVMCRRPPTTDLGVQLLLLSFLAGEHKVISMEVSSKIRWVYFCDKVSVTN
ncbi:hypothetical protein A9K81_20390 [Pseudomonas syringae pv. syringae]|nr:hypothetical protein A9K81_20390 [Pseudomonas syringae pv. syringae]